LRYGVIADVHGNLHALEAALRVLSKAGVDEYLCAGDLVGYGPLPNECVAAVAELGARCVVGNHDLIALGRLSDERCSRLARDSLRWTSAELSSASRLFLERLPGVLVAEGGVVVAHGSLHDPQAYVREPHERMAQLWTLERHHPAGRLLVLGHTHRPVAHAQRRGTLRARRDGTVSLETGERCLLNPGSVGQSRQRTVRSQFVVVDLEQSYARFYAVRYDVAGCRRALRERGLAASSHHSKPRPLRDGARAVRRAVTRS
jgi:predicted phosphodiesterase